MEALLSISKTYLKMVFLLCEIVMILSFGLNSIRYFFHMQNDIYICGMYIWPEESPMYNICDVDRFDVVQYLIMLVKYLVLVNRKKLKEYI